MMDDPTDQWPRFLVSLKKVCGQHFYTPRIDPLPDESLPNDPDDLWNWFQENSDRWNWNVPKSLLELRDWLNDKRDVALQYELLRDDDSALEWLTATIHHGEQWFQFFTGVTVIPASKPPCLLEARQTVAILVTRVEDTLRGPPDNKVESKKGAKPRGRRPNTDAVQDNRIDDAWKTRRYETYEELACGFGVSRDDVARAIDRHRHRLSKQRKNSRRK